MKNKNKIPIPRFKSIDEMADFFDNISTVDLDTEEVNFQFARLKPGQNIKRRHVRPRINLRKMCKTCRLRILRKYI